jgi:bacterioferritin-associated ferredoxin
MERPVHLPVTKCVCHDLEFGALKDLARSMDFDFDSLRAWSGCCTGCGTCEPYVRLMLRTGQTRFTVLSAAEAAKVVADARNEKGPPG